MIKILDCTLRDGGYINNWEFGKLTKQSIISHLLKAKVDIIECGFVSQKKHSSVSNSLYNFPHDVRVEKKNSQYAVMINYGEYNFDELEPKEKNNIDIVRFAFHKKDYIDAVEQGKKIIKLGYKLFMQPMNALAYSEDEYLDLIKRCNQLEITAFYIVDSFGNMKRNDVHRFYNLVNKNLRKDISLGFHSHNNLQLSFSNSQYLIQQNEDTRELIIDSTLLGMGRGAGNLCTELFIQYLNDERNGKYNLLPVLETINSDILPIKQETDWGYSIPYYIASINSCHPNYATFLTFKHSLSVSEINKIIKSIPNDKKQIYDENFICDLYTKYQNKSMTDKSGLNALKQKLENKNVLLLAPGKSIADQSTKIISFLAKHKCVVVSVNAEIDYLEPDFLFVSNKNRFDKIKKSNKLITTSNIGYSKGISVSYNDLLIESPLLTDNAGLMAFKLVSLCLPKTIYLAGYDGYSRKDNENYFEKKYKLINNKEDVDSINNEMAAQISKIISTSNSTVKFLTPSLYKIKK